MTKLPNGRVHGLQYIGQVPCPPGLRHGLRLFGSHRSRAGKRPATRPSTSKCHPACLNWLRYCWP